MHQLNHDTGLVYITNALDEAAKEIIWETFFRSRQRGVSLEFHYPWVSDKNKMICISIQRTENGNTEALAALMVKRERLNGIGDIGFVGLVCVNPKFRRQGLSTVLLQQTEAYCRRESIKQLVLWTTVPKVYEKVGYKTDACEFVGIVSKAVRPANCAYGGIEHSQIKQVENNAKGVPSFGTSVIEYSIGETSITVCMSTHGVSLIESSGATSILLKIMWEMLPDKWTINLGSDRSIIYAMQQFGFHVDLKDGAHRMTKSLTEEVHKNIPYVSWLDRI